ncbi:hypothetical protein [Ensifer sp. MJa1]|uniref:hypothetical protein n=1 Tax=Ensifer sp. MJa1 TaxID=2919888 RepID=UPI003008C159
MTEPAGIRLYIVTDDPARAALAVVACFVTEVPDFIRIVTDANEIRAIPDGARCIGHWFEWRDQRPSEAQLAWQELRALRADQVEGVSKAFFERIDEWNAKRRAAERKRLAAIVSEMGGSLPSSSTKPPENSMQRWF